MALIEGGAFVCGLDGFSTLSIDEWNKHGLKKEANGDTHLHEAGDTRCINCGEIVFYQDMPFQKLDKTGSKNIALRCEACEASVVGNTKRRSNIKK